MAQAGGKVRADHLDRRDYRRASRQRKVLKIDIQMIAGKAVILPNVRKEAWHGGSTLLGNRQLCPAAYLHVFEAALL